MQLYFSLRSHMVPMCIFQQRFKYFLNYLVQYCFNGLINIFQRFSHAFQMFFVFPCGFHQFSTCVDAVLLCFRMCLLRFPCVSMWFPCVFICTLMVFYAIRFCLCAFFDFCSYIMSWFSMRLHVVYMCFLCGFHVFFSKICLSFSTCFSMWFPCAFICDFCDSI